MSIILIILSVTILRASEDTDQFSVDLCIPQTCRVSDTEAKLEREFRYSDKKKNAPLSD